MDEEWEGKNRRVGERRDEVGNSEGGKKDRMRKVSEVSISVRSQKVL